MIARFAYKRYMEDLRKMEKQKLSKMLKGLKSSIKTCFNARPPKVEVEDPIERAVIKIQGCVRKMLSRKHFRLSLYKLMLLKNIVENKVHKEKMQMLYAFEQLIINTEDENEPDYYDEAYGEEGGAHHDGTRAVVGQGEERREDGEDEYGEDDLYGDESGELDPASAAVAYYHRHKKFPQMQRIPVEAEYMSNPSDVIDEEEFEDSETDPSSPPKRHRKMD